MQRLKLVRKNGQDIISVLTDNLNTLKLDFEDYKIKNNIDTYFQKFIDNDSGKRVLKEIQDFLSRKKEEDEEVPFNYTKLLEELRFSGATVALDEVHEDFEHYIKMKVQYFIED
jgi:hypothetical protein